MSACAAVLLISAALHAQHRVLDLSGRWWLVAPTAAERALDTLAIVSPDQLLIRHSRRAIVIAHPSKSGTHPEAGTFSYGLGGLVDGAAGQGNNVDEQWSVSHIGTQLMISRSTFDRPDVRLRVARGSMWRLDGPDRLIIEFGEERPGERPKIATRTYVKVASQ